MKHSLQFGNSTIEYRLEYSARKSLGITVTPEMEVRVKAPENADIQKIRDVVKKKAPWIIKQLSFFLSFQPKLPSRKFISGETHLYLGRQYRLKVITDKTKVQREEVKLKGQFIEVYAADKTSVKTLLEKWYLEKAKEKIKPLAEKLFLEFSSRHNMSSRSFKFSLRAMPMRWGSCTAKGSIILNPELIKAPKSCIEYVIIHELCHLIHHNHNQKFIDLQTREMKDWEKWKMKLEMLLA
jgi:predicted metal-dependent hydrolase